MKKIYFLLFTLLLTTASFGQVIVMDNFTYPDGSLVGNGAWVSHSGTAGDLMVVSGKVLVQHGTPSEDANLPFTSVTGNIYYGIDIIVNDPGAPISGTDNEYFAHFKDTGNNFFGRMDVVPPSGAGDFSIGIATANSTAEAVWATDLTYGVTYRAIVRYDQATNIAQLWINASAESDTSISGVDGTDPGTSIASFALRQSDSDLNEGILVDNLIVAQSFNDVTLSTDEFSVNSFKIYPNPTSVGYVNITSNNTNTMSVAVFDVLGKQVLNKTVSNNRLNVSALRSGIYIMKISQDKATVTKKLVIK